jgi:hypothetical protein
LKKSWRRGDSEEQLGDIRTAGREAYEAALNQNRRWSAADIAHSAITLLTSMLIGAAFWVVALSFFVGFRMNKEGKRVPARAADAMTLAAGLLILWFPTRLYTEWHLHFYSLDKLAEFQMFWVMLFVAAAALLLLVLLRFSRSFQTSLSAVCAAGSAATGIVALIKPEALWYVWQVIGDMAAIPWAILVIVTAFTSVLIARMAHADA